MGRLHHVAITAHEMMHTSLAKERMISDWYRATYGLIRRTMAIARSNDTSLDSFFAKDAADALQLATDMQNRIAPLLKSDQEKALYTALIDARGKYAQSRDALKKAKGDGQNELASKMLDETFVPAAKEYELRLCDLDPRPSVNTVP
jgi:methyl-accepting chemotaxis protein